MPFQHVPGPTAVPNLVSDVEGGALLQAVLELTRVPTSITGQGCRERSTNRKKGLNVRTLRHFPPPPFVVRESSSR